MIILVKYASRNRPELFFKGLDSIYNNAIDKENIHVLCSFDLDDTLMNNPITFEQLGKYKNLTYSFEYSKNKVSAINRDLERAPYFDILINFSDDQVFTVLGFDEIIRKDMNDSFLDTDGVLHYHDDNNGKRLMTMSIIGKKYFDRTGYIYFPGYESVSCDHDAMQVAKRLGKYKYIDAVIFKHNHWRYGLSKFDNLYMKNDTAPVHQRDKKTYKDRLISMNRLLIKYATRGRVNLFFETLKNVVSTIKTDNYQIIVSADIDDATMNNPETIGRIKNYNKVSIYFGEPLSKVSAINRDMEHAKEWDWLINMSDDFKFTVKHWDYSILSRVIDTWRESLDFFAHFNDGFVAEKLPTMSIMGMDYYLRDNYIYHPSYGSVSCDAEAMFVSMMRGRHHYFNDIFFHHKHPANLRFESDETYRRNDKWGELDTKNYFERMKRLFYVTDAVMIPQQLSDEIKTLK